VLPERGYHHGDLRQALLAAAELELTEKGVEGFTLRGCAKRAGVSHAAPAHHFRDANALLTALAVEGFVRFSKAIRDRQDAALNGARGALILAGLGYIDFARANPALFRLMFSSSRPDFEQGILRNSASAAFDILVEAVAASTNAASMAEAGMQDVAAAWAVAHGLADLLLSGRLLFLGPLEGAEGDRILAGILQRALP